MSDNKSRDIFYGVVAIATLIIAVIGATLAYFTLTVKSNEGVVNATADIVSFSYKDGQQVSMQAERLIPASFEVVQSAYKKAKTEGTFNSTEETPKTNVCIDPNGRQVCSIYRFSIDTEKQQDIIASLNSEENGFTTGLNYALYKVGNPDDQYDETRWHVLDNTTEGQPIKSLKISPCNNIDEEGKNKCFTGEGPSKKYEAVAINSIFGYKKNESGLETTPLRQFETIKPGTTTYDLVLFLKESEGPQNEDQGKSFKGTIVVELKDGSADKITGEKHK